MSYGRTPAPVELHAGFIPLIDCAPFIIAKERGFDARHGLSLVLHKEVSWANIRDKVEVEMLDCAIMLAPMPLASTLGLGGRPPVPMIAAMATSLNGNAITVSTSLFDEMMRADRASAKAGGMAAAKSLARVVEGRRARGSEPLTLGMVHPFSSHNYELRYWLAAAGIDPVNDVNLVVIPPPLIAGSLKSGRIDGFCVGEPWNSVAVSEGSGVIVATKSELWVASPEKVLAVRSDFAENNAEVTLSLIRAVTEACAWLDDPGNRREAAQILSRPDYVGLPQETLSCALEDKLVRGGGLASQHCRDIVIFSRGGANFPWVSHAIWLLTQMIRWGQVRAPFDVGDIARRVYRPDLFRSALRPLGIHTPDSDIKPEGGGMFFGSETFNPEDPVTYIDRFALRDRRIDLSLYGPQSKGSVAGKL